MNYSTNIKNIYEEMKIVCILLYFFLFSKKIIQKMVITMKNEIGGIYITQGRTVIKVTKRAHPSSHSTINEKFRITFFEFLI